MSLTEKIMIQKLIARDPALQKVLDLTDPDRQLFLT